MYYSMKNIGDENAGALVGSSDQDEKWRLLEGFAHTFGFSGIHIEAWYQEKYGLFPENIPEYIKRAFRLTFHAGTLSHLNDAEDEIQAGKALEKNLRSSISMQAEDVSIHPPLLANISLSDPAVPGSAPQNRERIRENFQKLIGNWAQRYLDEGISLSIESHVSSDFFVFRDIYDYCDFILGIPGLGGLIDVSHNCFDGYEMKELLSAVRKIPVRGFHLSDAVRGVGLAEGTHLPVGRGIIDFGDLISEYSDDSVYGALEVRGKSEGISESLAYMKKL